MAEDRQTMNQIASHQTSNLNVGWASASLGQHYVDVRRATNFTVKMVIHWCAEKGHRRRRELLERWQGVPTFQARSLPPL